MIGPVVGSGLYAVSTRRPVQCIYRLLQQCNVRKRIAHEDVARTRQLVMVFQLGGYIAPFVTMGVLILILGAAVSSFLPKYTGLLHIKIFKKHCFHVVLRIMSLPVGTCTDCWVYRHGYYISPSFPRYRIYKVRGVCVAAVPHPDGGGLRSHPRCSRFYVR